MTPFWDELHASASPISVPELLSDESNSKKIKFPQNEVHLWLISLQTKDHLLNHCFNTLTAKEKKRANTFLSEQARRTFIVSRTALRKTIRLYHDKLSDDFQISIGPYGKPYLEDPEYEMPINFNLSHSGGFVLLGFSDAVSIGVDIQEKKELAGLMGIAKRVFSEHEFEYLLNLAAEKKSQFFYRLWACKEAILKSDGVGFHHDPKDICLISQEKSMDEGNNLFQIDKKILQWADYMTHYSLAWSINSLSPHKLVWQTIN